MGCGASQDLVDNDEVDLIHRICILIENKHPSAETIWELLKKLPNRDRKLWKGCWSTPLGNRPIKATRLDEMCLLGPFLVKFYAA